MSARHEVSNPEQTTRNYRVLPRGQAHAHQNQVKLELKKSTMARRFWYRERLRVSKSQKVKFPTVFPRFSDFSDVWIGRGRASQKYKVEQLLCSLLYCLSAVVCLQRTDWSMTSRKGRPPHPPPAHGWLSNFFVDANQPSVGAQAGARAAPSMPIAETRECVTSALRSTNMADFARQQVIDEKDGGYPEIPTDDLGTFMTTLVDGVRADGAELAQSAKEAVASTFHVSWFCCAGTGCCVVLVGVKMGELARRILVLSQQYAAAVVAL